MTDQMDAAGKIALVTGANKGIGFEIARSLAAKGAIVLVGARNAAAGQEAAAKIAAEGGKAEFLPVDVTDAASVAAAADEIERRFGKLDILVNNAAISIERGVEPSQSNIDVMRQTFETNVFAVVSVTSAMLPLIRKSEAGRIVNMSSGLGSLTLQTGPEAPLFSNRILPYNSSKTAVNAITVMFANELYDTGIKVNAANPGLCATDMTRGNGRPASEGAAVAVNLALLGPDGPTGGLYGDAGKLPW